MAIQAVDWYSAITDRTSLYQGDVLDNVPLIYLPNKLSKWIVLRPNLKGAMTVDEVLGGQIPKWFQAAPQGQIVDCWQHGGEEYVAAKAKLMRVMLLTQTCDLANRSTYQVAPLLLAKNLPEARRESLRQNDVQYMFFLPGQAPAILEDAYADLSQTTGVPKAYFRPDSVVARLTPTATRDLQSQIAQFFARPFGFNSRDRSPSTGTYACIRCFYQHFRLHKEVVTEGANFPECEHCNDGLWSQIEAFAQEEIEFPPSNLNSC